jgi:HEAT repeat protein
VLAFLLTDRQNKRWDVAADARVDAVMEHMKASEDLMSRALGAYLGMERGGDKAPMVAVLAELEKAEAFEHRLLGAIAMQILDKQEAVPRLRKLLDDDSPEVRRTAAIVLQHYFEVSDERIRRELEAGEPSER